MIGSRISREVYEWLKMPPRPEQGQHVSGIGRLMGQIEDAFKLAVLVRTESTLLAMLRCETLRYRS